MNAEYNTYRELRILENRKRRLRIVRRQRILLALIVALLIFSTTFLVTGIILRAQDSAPSYKYYTSISVKSGDTLGSIAQRYISKEYRDIDEYVNEVRSINHIDDSSIYAGEKIIVPYYSPEYK